MSRHLKIADIIIHKDDIRKVSFRHDPVHGDIVAVITLPNYIESIYKRDIDSLIYEALKQWYESFDTIEERRLKYDVVFDSTS